MLQKYKDFSFNPLVFFIPLNMKCLYLFFFLFIGLAQAQNHQGWELKRNKKGIRVYTRLSEGAEIKEYRAQMIVKNNPENIKNYILDYDLLTLWNKTIVDYKIIKSADGKELVYMENEAPWPLENRDNISEISLEKLDHGGFKIHINGIVYDSIPFKKDVVRMNNVHGFWEVKPYENGSMVIQQLYADPGGSIPKSLTNSFIASEAYKAFADLKEICEQ